MSQYINLEQIKADLGEDIAMALQRQYPGGTIHIGKIPAISREEKIKIYELVNKGVPIQNIAEKYQCSIRTIYNYLSDVVKNL